VYTNIDQTLVESLHELLNGEIGALDCHVITIEYRRTHFWMINSMLYMYNIYNRFILCNMLV